MTEPKLISQQFTQASPAIASYDYADISNKQGFQTFYFATATDVFDAASNKILTKEATLYSEDISTKVNGDDSGSYTNIGTLTHTLPDLQAPLTLKGTATANIGWGVEGDANSQGASKAYLEISVKKNGTEIGSGQSDEVQGLGSAGSFVETISAIKIDLTQTHFQKGDNIVVAIEIWEIKTSGTQSGSVHIGHDPLNRDDGDEMTPSSIDTITSSRIHIPQRIEI